MEAIVLEGINDLLSCGDKIIRNKGLYSQTDHQVFTVKLQDKQNTDGLIDEEDIINL